MCGGAMGAAWLFAGDGAPLAEFGWLAGSWKGKLGASTVIEEIWSPAQDGVMMGMFRIVSKGKASLYEFMTLEQRGAEVVMRLKHFSGGLVAREDKEKFVEFRMVGKAGEGWRFVAEEETATVTLIYEGKAGRNLMVDFRKVPKAGGREEHAVFGYERQGS